MPRIVWLVMTNALLIFLFMAMLGFRINISESYPLGIYKRVSGEHSVNTLVESCLPESVAKHMIDREYIPGTGNCGGYPAVIKRIYGVEGDTVEVNKVVAINGADIPGSTVLKYDSEKRPLTAAPSTTISTDYVWLMANNIPDSYDARYFGQTPIDLIVTNLRPVWTIK